MKKDKKFGFTLTEIVIVMLVIAVVVGVSIRITKAKLDQITTYLYYGAYSTTKAVVQEMFNNYKSDDEDYTDITSCSPKEPEPEPEPTECEKNGGTPSEDGKLCALGWRYGYINCTTASNKYCTNQADKCEGTVSFFSSGKYKNTFICDPNVSDFAPSLYTVDFRAGAFETCDKLEMKVPTFSDFKDVIMQNYSEFYNNALQSRDYNFLETKYKNSLIYKYDGDSISLAKQNPKISNMPLASLPTYYISQFLISEASSYYNPNLNEYQTDIYLTFTSDKEFKDQRSYAVCHIPLLMCISKNDNQEEQKEEVDLGPFKIPTIPLSGAKFCEKFGSLANTNSESCNGTAIINPATTSFADATPDIILRNGMKMYNVSQCPVQIPDLVGNTKKGTYEKDKDGNEKDINEWGYVIYIDIDGKDSNGKLWEDVYPFYVTLSGTVIPAYNINNADIKKTVGGDSKFHLQTSVLDEFNNDTGFHKEWRKKSVSFKESACYIGLVGKDTLYCKSGLEPESSLIIPNDDCTDVNSGHICRLKVVKPIKIFGAGTLD